MKYYSLKFGSGDPRTYSGMNATFLYFVNMTTGATVAPPSITETIASSGIYQFQWGTTQPIAFLADAATTSPGAALRYITGQLDPADRSDEFGTTIIAIGTTHTGQGVSLLATGVSLTYGQTIIYSLGLSIYALGVSNFAFGTTFSSLAGGATSLIGDSSTQPTTLFGYLRRVDALLEGQSRFTKGTGTLTNYDWTGVTTISTRTVTNSVSLVTKI